MLFSPAIGAAVAANYRFLWVPCSACRTMQSVDLRAHPDAAITAESPHCRAVPQIGRSCPQNGEHPDYSRFGGTINELFVTTVTPMFALLVETCVPKGEVTDG